MANALCCSTCLEFLGTGRFQLHEKIMLTSGFSGPASVLSFLRAHLRKAEPFTLLKMLAIGPPRQGKTALLEALQTGRPSPFTPTDCSISTSTWELDKPNGGKNSVRKTDRYRYIRIVYIQYTHSAWRRYQTIPGRRWAVFSLHILSVFVWVSSGSSGFITSRTNIRICGLHQERHLA